MNDLHSFHCLAVSGGVGGAKLALGLSHVLAPDDLTVVANTGDDFVHLGFSISPDLDTVMYTLAGMSNRELGWGQADESWNFLQALETLGGENWFRIGDRDLATHVIRTGILAQGNTLSEATAWLCAKVGIRHRLVPMTDDSVSTIVITRSGERLSFQHYFVRDRCEPEISGIEFSGIEDARPSPGFLQAMESRGPGVVVLCPSNPFVSVAPVLNIPGVKTALPNAGRPVVAVSPIVEGQALKGPAAKMMDELGMPRTSLAVAEYYVKNYPGLISHFVLDERDQRYENAVQDLGLAAVVTNTVMISLQDRIDLARTILTHTRETMT